jgi:hypothetical protein
MPYPHANVVLRTDTTLAVDEYLLRNVTTCIVQAPEANHHMGKSASKLSPLMDAKNSPRRFSTTSAQPPTSLLRAPL